MAINKLILPDKRWVEEYNEEQISKRALGKNSFFTQQEGQKNYAEVIEQTSTTPVLVGLFRSFPPWAQTQRGIFATNYFYDLVISWGLFNGKELEKIVWNNGPCYIYQNAI